jgi:hypothetical protein
VEVMQEEGIDPVRTKNQPLVKELSAATKPADHKEARDALHAAQTNVVQMKPATQSAPTEVEEFAMRIVRMFEARYGSYRGADRDEQIRFVLERVVNVLGADVHELRTYGRSDRVPKPKHSKPE